MEGVKEFAKVINFFGDKERHMFEKYKKRYIATLERAVAAGGNGKGSTNLGFVSTQTGGGAGIGVGAFGTPTATSVSREMTPGGSGGAAGGSMMEKRMSAAMKGKQAAQSAISSAATLGLNLGGNGKRPNNRENPPPAPATESPEIKYSEEAPGLSPRVSDGKPAGLGKRPSGGRTQQAGGESESGVPVGTASASMGLSSSSSSGGAAGKRASKAADRRRKEMDTTGRLKGDDGSVRKETQMTEYELEEADFLGKDQDSGEAEEGSHRAPPPPTSSTQLVRKNSGDRGTSTLEIAESSPAGVDSIKVFFEGEHEMSPASTANGGSNAQRIVDEVAKFKTLVTIKFDGYTRQSKNVHQAAYEKVKKASTSLDAVEAKLGAIHNYVQKLTHAYDEVAAQVQHCCADLELKTMETLYQNLEYDLGKAAQQLTLELKRSDKEEGEKG